MNFMQWLKSSIEDKESKTSGKRLTGFWFVVLTTFIVFAGIHNTYVCNNLPTNYLFFLIIMVTAVLLLFMVITVENIIQILKIIRNKENKE